MERDIQVGKNCTLKIREDSPSAIEFGDEVVGCIKGRDEMEVGGEEELDTLYERTVGSLPVIVVVDKEGITWKVPQGDIELIKCE
jgi:hypothetical protein